MSLRFPPWPCAVVPNVPAFLAMLHEVAADADDWRLLRHDSETGKLEFENVASSKSDARVVVVAHPDPSNNTAVLFSLYSSENEHADKPHIPTAEMYTLINTLFRKFLPLVRLATQRLGIRMSVHLAKYRQYMPSKRLVALIDAFASTANLAALHHSDWNQFYKIVRYAHSHRMLMTGKDFAEQLCKRHVPNHLVQELSSLYEFGREILACDRSWERWCRRKRSVDSDT